MDALAINTHIVTESGLAGRIADVAYVHDIDTDEFSHILYRIALYGGGFIKTARVTVV